MVGVRDSGVRVVAVNLDGLWVQVAVKLGVGDPLGRAEPDDVGVAVRVTVRESLMV